MAGVIGSQVPVYDINLHYKSSDTHHSLLVDQPHLGAALAAGFHPGSLVSKTTPGPYETRKPAPFGSYVAPTVGFADAVKVAAAEAARSPLPMPWV